MNLETSLYGGCRDLKCKQSCTTRSPLSEKLDDRYPPSATQKKKKKKQWAQMYVKLEEPGLLNRNGSTLNRGVLQENLRIEVPGNARRFSELGFEGSGQKAKISGVPSYLREKVQPHKAYATPVSKLIDLGTPSAPPIVDIGADEDNSELASGLSTSGGLTGTEHNSKKGFSETPEEAWYGNGLGIFKGLSRTHDSNKITFQKLQKRPVIEINKVLQRLESRGNCCRNDALRYFQQGNSDFQAVTYQSKRMASSPWLMMPVSVSCLNAWARGCVEAPEFLRDECQMLQLAETVVATPMHADNRKDSESNGQTLPLKVRKLIGKVLWEESLRCLILLKSSTEDATFEPNTAVTLLPGSGDHHDFFPENQGDALLLEKYKILLRKVLGSNINTNFSQLTIIMIRFAEWTDYGDSAYDLLLEASMRAQQFCARSLRYLSYVMDVATPTKDCLELIHELLVPVMKARSDRSMTRQEKSLLLDCETEIEGLLATVFENYKSLDESCPTGLADMSAPIPETAAPALAPAVQIYTLLHDILAQDAQMTLRNYIQTAAAKRCRKHLIETDTSSINLDGFVMDSVTTSLLTQRCKEPLSPTYQMKSRQILRSITNIYFLVQLISLASRFTADLERNLDSWNISSVQGGVDSRGLFHSYIMVWVEDMQLHLLELCKAEKVLWSGVVTTILLPFAEEMFKTKQMLTEYEVVINRWPQYTVILENAVANVERAIIKAMEKQYNEILTPLKDSIPKKLGMQVQKLARRQSTTLYSIPNQLGTFLNTIKRILTPYTVN
ncbi:hypothetical protein HAX54_017432 [Datura stramonium]|uniref:Uncharacterized protein n=1 Tax=Datura stramonium TaxID=4076 RepID=A0ABS8UMQ6_DATST|nr:hypothetical protein [Datura stramonium]